MKKEIAYSITNYYTKIVDVENENDNTELINIVADIAREERDKNAEMYEYKFLACGLK